MIYIFLQRIQVLVYSFQKGQAQPHVYGDDIAKIKVPIPPKDIREKIVEEINNIENDVINANNRIVKIEKDIEILLSDVQGNILLLKDIAPFVATSINFKDIATETYVTTDNMLQNKLGVIPFGGTANISSITEYKKEDILISNIRPYLKKIWFADKDGGCSKDVLVLRSSDTSKYLPKYLYYMLRRDAFFAYAMEGKKGLKMPRGNKEEIKKYKIPMPSLEEQQRIVSQIEEFQLEIKAACEIIENATSQKQAVLNKYL